MFTLYFNGILSGLLAVVLRLQPGTKGIQIDTNTVSCEFDE